LKESEITKFSLDRYKLASSKLASSICRRESLGGGVCILISNNIIFQSNDLGKFCHEKTFEICAVKLHVKMIKLIIFAFIEPQQGT
jgi:hypothetical protein